MNKFSKKYFFYCLFQSVISSFFLTLLVLFNMYKLFISRWSLLFILLIPYYFFDSYLYKKLDVISIRKSMSKTQRIIFGVATILFAVVLSVCFGVLCIKLINR